MTINIHERWESATSSLFPLLPQATQPVLAFLRLEFVSTNYTTTPTPKLTQSHGPHRLCRKLRKQACATALNQPSVHLRGPHPRWNSASLGNRGCLQSNREMAQCEEDDSRRRVSLHHRFFQASDHCGSSSHCDTRPPPHAGAVPRLPQRLRQPGQDALRQRQGLLRLIPCTLDSHARSSYPPSLGTSLRYILTTTARD
ncbi:hypothetical protein C8R44DRAFT_858363 [Mycena epipterygia]|nr:hypothetical protein C8R44DRAFT_858363 [Mycena epipterygia]